MKLLINASNRLGGGGLQVALSFISECRNFSQNSYILVLNSDNAELLDRTQFSDLPNFTFYTLEYKNYFTLAARLSSIEKYEKPDAVFTVFGPSYWKAKSPQCMGYANPYYIYSDSPFFDSLSFAQRFKIFSKRIVCLYFFKRDADAIICETQDALNRIREILKSPKKNYFCVSNTASAHFENFILSKKIGVKKSDGDFRFLFVSKYYAHKNFELIPKIVLELKKRGIKNIKFCLTLDADSFSRIVPEDLREWIVNFGFVQAEDCPSLYSICDAIIQPSFLEIFSANYIEAMKMQKPILASDYSFAHTVCKNAALYFNPENLSDAVESVLKIANDKKLRETLVSNGNAILKNIPTATGRAEEYLKIAERFVMKQNYSKKEIAKKRMDMNSRFGGGVKYNRIFALPLVSGAGR